MRKHGGVLKTLVGFKTAMIETLFRSRVVRRRMADSHLGIILSDFALFLVARGHVLTSLQAYVQVAEHFSRWLGEHGLPLHQIGETLVEQFVRGHLPRCRCPKPHPIHPRNCRSGLGLLLAFLRKTKRIKPPGRTPDSAIDRLVRRYDAYLNDVAGLAFETRFYRRRYACEFLQSRLRRGRIQLTGLSPKFLRRYIQRRAPGLKPASLRVLATSLRSFLRFLHFTGRGKSHWVQAISPPVAWPRSTPPQVLSQQQYHDFLHIFDRGTRTGRRDFAMALCLCLLGMRTHEVAALTLEDIDWRRSELILRKTKQRRERALPLPARLARALVDYLQHGRPPTNSRSLFVRHQAPLGQPLQVHHVRGAIRRALKRSKIKPDRVHLLRHTFATQLHRKGVGLKAIADLLGHASLDTSARYALVNLNELRQTALPWPERKS
jgi:site-specific recombinase XerD